MRATLSILCLVIALVSCAGAPLQQPHRIVVEFPVNDGMRGEFIDELNKILIDTRAFEGCLDAHVWTNEMDANLVWIYEEWETREHQVAYINWRTETNNTAHLGKYIAGDVRHLWLQQH